MPINLTGMASGLDTDSIIQQLMQVETTKVTAVQKRQIQVQQHKSDLDNVRSALNKIKTAAAAPDNSKVTINVAANASAQDVATAINANEGAPVYAAVIKNNGVDTLVFSSRKTGEH